MLGIARLNEIVFFFNLFTLKLTYDILKTNKRSLFVYKKKSNSASLDFPFG